MSRLLHPPPNKPLPTTPPPNRPLPPLPTLTVYCFGTGSASTDETITATLAAATTSPKFITEGVGSGGWFGGHGVPATPDGHTPGGKNVVKGLGFGVGTDYNVDAAVDHIRQLVPRGLTKVNLCGWSRGAVTCFKIAHELQARNMGNIDLHIFAFDPVPGDAAGNAHMWRGMSLGGNVKKCIIILAQHERRKEFHPAVPSFDEPRFVVDVMPGNHRSILQKMGGLGACYQVNLDRCAKFLTHHGTVLDYDKWLSDPQIVTLYTEMLRRWGNYEAAGRDGGKGRVFGSTDRVVKGFNREEITRLSPASPVGMSVAQARLMPFFINDHHARKFRKGYARLHDVLRYGLTPAGWQDELRTLALFDPDTLDLVIQHLQKIGISG